VNTLGDIHRGGWIHINLPPVAKSNLTARKIIKIWNIRYAPLVETDEYPDEDTISTDWRCLGLSTRNLEPLNLFFS
jgi:hypothetical protein